MNKEKHFFLISDDADLYQNFKDIYTQAQWTVFERGRGAIELIFNNPPDLLIVDNKLQDMGGMELIRIFKSENVYRQVPVIICLDIDDLTSELNLTQIEVDDFLMKPLDRQQTRIRLDLVLARAAWELDASPLTKLPGNTSIIQKIQDMMDRKQNFALAYADLDNFKSYNDKYGFSRGDEILMMTARIIVNTIRAFAGMESFVGHIGGDDFVFIVPPDQAENVCQILIRNFDGIVPNFYDPEDRERGFIRSTDRKGSIQDFPMMSVSIAVVFNIDGELNHYGQASEIAMNLKKVAKKSPGSAYVLDRRKSS
ncbi:GGDEF domain-containing protein [Desulfonatronovibrio magnus]|uniref:GGDEF domain-containing protein n=1 Tax=Desulfonatronovibrio magnus TaxID=698827 RepID=UPI0005EAEA1A|nr:diguanylate cyclase [Desulfonatronovibrio magnus]